MKSIVQEGSTISKAVESAWQSAGKPHEFTVKVLEEPQHNFIGMTTRSAKIALFFKDMPSPKPSSEKPERFRTDRNERGGERSDRSQRPKKQGRGQQREFTGQKPYAKETRPARPNLEEESGLEQEREARPTRPAARSTYQESARVQQGTQEAHEGPVFDGVFWTPEMITMAKDWLQGSLVAMDLPNLNYSTDVNRLYFKVSFEEPVNQNPTTERQIFRSFAMLLMQHMRNKLKRPLKGFKVVLSRGGQEIEEE